mmetsp:Transcript_92021/g.213873  ORF Transcript_92021/g.213873 Transcript_92021/m.213873 type:complete len:211 (+) Transcript_92021:355-987(+)
MSGDNGVLDDHVVLLVLANAHLGLLATEHLLRRQELVDSHGRKPAEHRLHLLPAQQPPDLILAGTPVTVHLNPSEQPRGAFELLSGAQELHLRLLGHPLDLRSGLLCQQLPVLRGHEMLHESLAHRYVLALLAIDAQLGEAHSLGVDLEAHGLQQLVCAGARSGHLCGHGLLAELAWPLEVGQQRASCGIVLPRPLHRRPTVEAHRGWPH